MNIKDYKSICREIRMLEDYIENLKEMLLKFDKSLIKGQEITGMPFVPGTADKVGDLAAKTADLKRSIEEAQQKLILKKTETILFINNINDSYIRQIVILRDIEGMRWYDVADAMGKSVTAESVRKAYERFMQKESGI